MAPTAATPIATPSVGSTPRSGWGMAGPMTRALTRQQNPVMRALRTLAKNFGRGAKRRDCERNGSKTGVRYRNRRAISSSPAPHTELAGSFVAGNSLRPSGVPLLPGSRVWQTKLRRPRSSCLQPADGEGDARCLRARGLADLESLYLGRPAAPP